MFAKMLIASGSIQQAARMLAEMLVDHDAQLSMLIRRAEKAEQDVLVHLRTLYGIKLENAEREKEFLLALAREFERVEAV